MKSRSKNHINSQSMFDEGVLSDEEALQSFKLYLQHRGRSEKTIRAYLVTLKYLRRFTAEQGMPSLLRLQTEHLQHFISSLWSGRHGSNTRRQKPNSVALYRAALKVFYSWATIEAGEIDDDPTKGIQRPSVPDTIQPDYDAKEIDKVLALLPQRSRDLIGLRDRAVILLLNDSGLRSFELSDLRCEDIDLIHRQIVVEKGKGGHMRHIGIGTKAAVAVDRYLSLRRRSGLGSPFLIVTKSGRPLGPNSLKSIVKRRFESAGLPYRGVHAFRRTWAQAFLSAGGDALDLKAQGGWHSFDMVERYAQASRAKRAVEAGHRFSPSDRLKN